MCDYQYGDGGSKARGIVHYNLHRGANGPPTLVGGLVDKTDDWIDDDAIDNQGNMAERIGARDEMFSWFIRVDTSG